MTAQSAIQSVLNPAGPQAGRIYDLWTLLLWTSVIVWVLVMAFLATALLRSRPSTDSVLRRGIGIATALTVVILFGLLLASTITGRGLASYAFESPVSIQVIGNQWWWEIRYEEGQPDLAVTTANEIHIPVGRPIVLKTTSHDVIHSFWVPNLAGKIDSIPNHVNTTWFRADKPGTYRGQCAEFCGMQHANMALFVKAETPAEFQAWLRNQRAPAHAPTNNLERRGQEVFVSSPCVLCHSIRGTSASGQVAPDLTHLGSRRTIAAGTLPNNKGSLGGWITDSQQVKPGNHMPAMNLAAQDMEPLLAYLESLQ